MREAIDETNRRRIKQSEYNRVHNITPKALNKKVVDVLQLDQDAKAPNISTKKQPLIDKLSLESFKSAYEVVKEIEKLAKQMKQCAKELEFEKAALIRDQIKELEDYMRLNLES
jgi:excinuclease ABC subunit B